MSLQVRIVDADGRVLTEEDLRSMQIWNPVLDHLCSVALERAKRHEAKQDD